MDEHDLTPDELLAADLLLAELLGERAADGGGVVDLAALREARDVTPVVSAVAADAG